MHVYKTSQENISYLPPVPERRVEEMAVWEEQLFLMEVESAWLEEQEGEEMSLLEGELVRMELEEVLARCSDLSHWTWPHCCLHLA